MTRAQEAEARSKATLALGDYIKEFNINPYTLASIAYITTSEELETSNELISIPKLYAQDLIELKSYKEAANSTYKDY
jgi:hypothetical protein